MADERKHEEPLPNLDPTVEVVERESLLDKVSEKPSSPSSLRFTVCSAERGQFTRFSAAENVRLRWLKRFVLGIAADILMWKNKKVSGGATSPPKIPQVHIPEEPLLQLASGLRIEITVASFIFARLLLEGISRSSFPFLTLAYIALVLLFTVPLIYDKYEDKVDSYGEKAMAELNKQYAVLDAKMLSKISRGPLTNKKKD
ncbi:unnamed protein product [Brassica napus]|uniref:Reticulon-like protein n=2 Tax=Brassica TaxID=3705 RepID=A0A816P0L1_BRANA|nr:unnamed protein product [Brassica napus]